MEFIEVTGALPGSEYRDGSELGGFALPETTGGGVGILDFDSDGRLDVCCAGGGTIDVARRTVEGHLGSLHRSLGPFQFKAVTPSAHLDMRSLYSAAIVASDFDNDGFTDLTVTGYANVMMFRNMGDGTFEQLPSIASEEGRWSSAAAYFDTDQDGDLDLYVTHYADWSFDKNPFCPSRTDANQQDYCGPTDFNGLEDSLYINQGDGTWEDASPTITSAHAYRGLGVVAADLDGDRDTDIYVTNDVEPNLLYRNEGIRSDPSVNGDRPIEWREVGIPSGAANGGSGKPEGSMGVAVGDFNLDGHFDLWVTNYEHELNALYRGEGKMIFSYVTHTTRIASTDEQSVGWGTAFLDVDLDGDEDLLIVNGHLEKYAAYRLQRPQVLENIEGKSFQRVEPLGDFFKAPIAGRGLAIGDFDSDGRLDFCATRIGEPHAIVRNASSTTGAWIRIQLIGTRSNRDAIGTVAVLRLSDSKQSVTQQVRQVIGGGSYASTNERCLHFGIPEGTQGAAGTLQVRWPSGVDQEVSIDRWNQTIVIMEEEPSR